MRRLARLLLPPIALAAAAWFVFAPALHGGWLWDDDIYITQNLLLRTPGGLLQSWIAPPGVNYFPVAATVQWLQWHCWGADPFGYHVTNVVLHVLSAWIFAVLLRRLGRLAGAEDDAVWPWLGGLLFLVHPVAVESVAWVAELKNTLSLPFLLLALSAYVSADERSGEGKAGRIGSYLLSLGLFAAAMLSKSTVAAFPVVLLLYSWWRRSKVTWRDVRWSAGFFALSLGLGLVTIWFERHRAIGAVDTGEGHLARIAAAGLGLAFYAEKLLLPAGLMPIYPRWTVVPPAAWQFLPWFGLALLAGWFWRRRESWGRHALFALGWFVLALAPVLGFIPMAYQQLSWVADHFAYLALLGGCGLAAAGFGAVRRRSSRLERVAIAILAAALCGAWAISARRYAENFRSGEALWRYAARHNPGAWAAHNNLGNALQDDRPAEAEAQYREAIRLWPGYAEAHSNLGTVLQNKGRLPEALAEDAAAVRLKPESAALHYNLGVVLAKSNRPAEAEAQYRRALRIEPDFAMAWANLGLAQHAAGGDWSATADDEAKALRLEPGLAAAEINLGFALKKLGNIEFRLGRAAEAEARYREELRLAPGDAAAHYDLAAALLAEKKPAAAAAEDEIALRLRPGWAEAWNNLGSARLLQGRAPEAAAAYRTALRLDPGLAQAKYNLARMGLPGGKP